MRNALVLAALFLVVPLGAAGQTQPCDANSHCAVGHATGSPREQPAAEGGKAAPEGHVVFTRYFFCHPSAGRCDLPTDQERYGAECACAGVLGQTGEGGRWQ